MIELKIQIQQQGTQVRLTTTGAMQNAQLPEQAMAYRMKAGLKLLMEELTGNPVVGQEKVGIKASCLKNGILIVSQYREGKVEGAAKQVTDAVDKMLNELCKELNRDGGVVGREIGGQNGKLG